MVIIFLIMLFSQSTPAQGFEALYFLEGVWKNTTSELIEEWTIEDHGLTGVAYRIEDGNKVILERLRIFIDDHGRVTLEAKVSHNLSAVNFTLIHEGEEFVFENAEHDYPKRIIYFKTDEGIGARIEGENGSNKREFFFKKVDQ